MKDFTELKRVDIRGYLARCGMVPKRDRGRYGMFYSPFRDERVASFKVDYDRNLWFDFGCGEGGSIIDLVMKMERCSFVEAVEKLERNDSGSFASGLYDGEKEGFEILKVKKKGNIAEDGGGVKENYGLLAVKEKGGFNNNNALNVQGGVGLETVKKKEDFINDAHKVQKDMGFAALKEKGDFGVEEYFENKGKKVSAVEIVEVKRLENRLLVNYMKERCINIDIARKYCREVYYRIAGRQYFAVGFENNSGGYELRNRGFKGCSSKDITTIVTDSIVTESIVTKSRSCCVFEGFIDFLSYLVLNDLSVCSEDVVVLNTAYNLQKAMPFISSHEIIKSFFDNDVKGRDISDILKSSCKNVISQSYIYEGYKDLNEYLMNRY